MFVLLVSAPATKDIILFTAKRVLSTVTVLKMEVRATILNKSINNKRAAEAEWEVSLACHLPQITHSKHPLEEEPLA